MIDLDTGSVVAEICHIKGQKPDSARYDSSQSDDERHAFENLILMCGPHHKVIDDDPEGWPVERLTKLKSGQEAAADAGSARPLSEDQTDALVRTVTAVAGNTAIGGSVITTVNQMGGQAAHSITNVGHQPRRFTKAAANTLVQRLRRLPPQNVDIVALMNDAESILLAQDLDAVVKEAGWTTSGVTQAVTMPVPRGVVIQMPSQTDALLTLGQWLIDVGFKAGGLDEPTMTTPTIRVGTAF